jgi:hypothetical protein
MAEDGPVTRTAHGVTVAVHVTPRARRQRIEGITIDADGRRAIKVAVTAVPEDGKANEAVIALLARAWRVPKSTIAVRSGAAARRKVLEISGDGTALKKRIEESMKDVIDG